MFRKFVVRLFGIVLLSVAKGLLPAIALSIIAFIFTACTADETKLQPGEVEVPFETVAMNETGATEITTGSQTFIIDASTNITQLQSLITPDDFKHAQQIDFSAYGLIGLFRVPGSGCDMFGMSIDRLILENDNLQIYATDWIPPAVCMQTNMSAYHLVKVRKSDLQLNTVKVSLHIEAKTRE